MLIPLSCPPKTENKCWPWRQASSKRIVPTLFHRAQSKIQIGEGGLEVPDMNNVRVRTQRTDKEPTCVHTGAASGISRRGVRRRKRCNDSAKSCPSMSAHEHVGPAAPTHMQYTSEVWGGSWPNTPVRPDSLETGYASTPTLSGVYPTRRHPQLDSPGVAPETVQGFYPARRSSRQRTSGADSQIKFGGPPGTR